MCLLDVYQAYQVRGHLTEAGPRARSGEGRKGPGSEEHVQRPWSVKSAGQAAGGCRRVRRVRPRKRGRSWKVRDWEVWTSCRALWEHPENIWACVYRHISRETWGERRGSVPQDAHCSSGAENGLEAETSRKLLLPLEWDLKNCFRKKERREQILQVSRRWNLY